MNQASVVHGRTRERRGRAPRPRTAAAPPLALLAPATVALGLLLGPLVALVLAAPWRRTAEVVTEPQVAQALLLSLRTSAAATVLCLVLGVPLAWVLARSSLPGRSAVRSLITMPLVLPPVVGGVALLSLLGRRGLLGRHLDVWFGVTIPFTTAAVVLSQAFVALPFLVLAVDGALRGADGRYEQVAATLGASRWFVLRRITLPLARPGVASGAVLCFARAIGEFGATATFAGSLPGKTRTMPLAIYAAMGTDPEQAVVLSLVLVALCLVVLVVLRSRWLTPQPGDAARRTGAP